MMGKADYKVGSATLDDLWYWMEERHAIYLRRQNGQAWPWTDDEILQTWKFTNVFRALDKGTVALNDMLEDRSTGLLPNIVWYRFFNRYEHATDIGWCDSYEDLYTKMLNKRDKRKPIFTGAHMTWAPANVCKVEAYLESCKFFYDNEGEILAELLDERYFQSLEFTFKHLMSLKVKGLGPFIAYEIVSDLRWHLLTEAEDIMTWANIGPGCKRGLERLGLPVTLQSLRDLLSQAPQLDRPLELREIEHSLCEFDKYQRVKTGAGRPRGRYHAPERQT